MHHQSSESLASVFSQALSIISRGSETNQPKQGGRRHRHPSGQLCGSSFSLDSAASSSTAAAATTTTTAATARRSNNGRSNRRSNRARAISASSASSAASASSSKRRHQILSREEEELARKEREERSIAIEKAYVHDVYEQISQHVSDSRFRAWPRVKQFLQELEPGSLVCDVGCGSGKYLDVNPNVFNIGSDRCKALAQIAREKDHEILHCDNLSLPFRDCSLDAVLSVAVIHHVATVERRVRALKELARVLRVGGRVMISVWAMEQRHRKVGHMRGRI